MGLESVLVLPILKKIKQIYPKHKLVVLCTYYYYNKEIVNCDYVDKLIIFKITNFISILSEIRKNNFKIVFDFEPYTNISCVISYLSGAGE